MDEVMLNKIKEMDPQNSEPGKHEVHLRYKVHNDQIELAVGDKSATHTLKPLRELYSTESDRSVSTLDDTFMPLMLGIEEELMALDDEMEHLHDAQIAHALSVLSMNPEERSGDQIVQAIQYRLRIITSMNNYRRLLF